MNKRKEIKKCKNNPFCFMRKYLRIRKLFPYEMDYFKRKKLFDFILKK